MKILITGAAGFIGFHLSNRLVADGHEVLGIDNLNDYYDLSLKAARLEILDAQERFEFHKGDIADKLVISANAPGWDEFFDATSVFADDFLVNREDLPPQAREHWCGVGD
ncbi:MAG: nucleoside-diphosphate-sugar epimerase [Lysobacterales bacterium]|jgi:nucleoside-diphosphate-sugar epimerase